MSKMPGYVALVLDEESSSRLRSCAVYDHVQATHVTMAFRPTEEEYRRYKNWVGQTVEFEGWALCMDDKVQALRVKGVPSENQHTHVTVSLTEGTKPVHSNAMLAGQHEEAACSFKGRGTVQFVRF